jgi:predicted signal transduction protein with EAL and GGDEF domain
MTSAHLEYVRQIMNRDLFWLGLCVVLLRVLGWWVRTREISDDPERAIRLTALGRTRTELIALSDATASPSGHTSFDASVRRVKHLQIAVRDAYNRGLRFSMSCTA